MRGFGPSQACGQNGATCIPEVPVDDGSVGVSSYSASARKRAASIESASTGSASDRVFAVSVERDPARPPSRPADRPKVTCAGESRRTARASAHTRTADPSPRATWPCRSADLRTTVAPTFRPKSSAVAAGAPPPTADRESLGIDPRLAGRRRERSRPGACQTDWENVGPAGPRGVRHHSVQAAPAVDDVGVDDQLDTQGRPLPPRDVAAIGT